MTEAELRAQRRSYVVGEAAMGSDADEAAYRAAVERGDQTAIANLDAEAEQRRARAEAYLAEDGRTGMVDPRIAAAVAAERERCAKIADDVATAPASRIVAPGIWKLAGLQIAGKIRSGES